MGTIESQPRDPSDFDVRLQQVFSAATRRLGEAFSREEIEGGYLQGFVGGGIIPDPTVAFKLREISPRVIDSRVSKGEWIVHVDEGETGETFLQRFWLVRVLRTTDSRTSATFRFDREGSTPIGLDDDAISLEDLVDPPDSLDFDDGLSVDALETVVSVKVDNLRRIARSMVEDFELVLYSSKN